jgi:hypothetical protein
LFVTKTEEKKKQDMKVGFLLARSEWPVSRVSPGIMFKGGLSVDSVRIQCVFGQGLVIIGNRFQGSGFR